MLKAVVIYLLGVNNANEEVMMFTALNCPCTYYNTHKLWLNINNRNKRVIKPNDDKIIKLCIHSKGVLQFKCSHVPDTVCKEFFFLKKSALLEK